MRQYGFFLVLVLVCANFFSLAEARPLNSSERLDTIAFGSCSFQRASKRHWSAIVAEKPQLWIWGGDNIYADRLWPEAREGEYEVLKSSFEYQGLLKQAMVVGTWDDHDYGFNNVGKGFADKVESQKLMLDFLDEPESSPRRTQEGVYTSYSFGPAGQSVKVILLDLRYFRDEPGADSDILGTAQWEWLERELITNQDQFIIIMSSTQMIPRDHKGDSWGEYPKSRERVLDLIDRIMAATGQIVVVLSGDRHLAEISKLDLPASRSALYEVTSSGLTHGSFFGDSPNEYRVGALFKGRNFGSIRLNWDAQPRTADLTVHDAAGKPVLKSQIPF